MASNYSIPLDVFSNDGPSQPDFNSQSSSSSLCGGPAQEILQTFEIPSPGIIQPIDSTRNVIPFGLFRGLMWKEL